MKKLAIIAMLLCAAYSAQAIKIIHGPYIQSVSETEATIIWVTDAKALSWVEVAPDDETHFYRHSRQKFYQTYFGKRVYGTVHKVRLTGLKPGTTYRYAVASKEVLEVVKHRVKYGFIATTDVYRKGAHRVTTLDAAKPSAEFLVLNDIHASQEKLEALLNCYEKGKTDFVVCNGDMVSYVPSTKALFDGFIDTSVKRFATDTPMFMVRGNHETRGEFSTSYLDYFPTSNNKPYYTFKHGEAFFVVLDCGEDKPNDHIEYYGTADYDTHRQEEAAWLQGVVESEEYKSAKYRIVFIHMPIIGGKKLWHGPSHASECFLPILNKANVTVLLAGHTHRYAYHAPNTTDATFPILVNAHDNALKAKICKDGVMIEAVDMEGKVKHTHTFR